MKVAIRNAGDAIGMAQVAEGAMNETSEILHRLREVAVQAANGTYSGANRVALNAEVVALKTELLRIAETTKFNDVKLLNGHFQDTTFEIGYDESPGHTHTLSIESVKPTDLGMWTIGTEQEKSATLSSVAALTSGAQVDTSSDHLFNTGDIITYEQGTQSIAGLHDGASYKVTKVDSDSFSLTEIDGTAITYGSTTNYGNGTGAKFHLQSLAGAPTVAEIGSDAPTSEVLNTEDMTVHGHVGSTKVTVGNAFTAKEIAEVISDNEGSTGVKATAQTNARISVSPNNNTDDHTVVSFKLKGMNTTNDVIISSTIKFGTGDGINGADLSDLRDKINGFTGTTGIYAKLSSDKSYIDIESPDGHDIVIDDFDMPSKTATASVTASAPATTGIQNASSTITTTGAHGFAVGDMIRATTVGAANAADTGIDLETTYFVKSVGSPTTFTLATVSPTGTTFTASAASTQTTTFVKLEKTLNIQSQDRDLNLKGTPVKLVDNDLGSDEGTTATGIPNAVNSMRLSGQVQFESAYVFTVVPDVNDSIFRAAPPAANLQKISDLDVLTVQNSHKFITAIDGALKRVDAERGDLGATMNRMEHTIDNLSNTVVNTEMSRGRLEDADMAAETAKLAKNQILQQAATAMLGQANQSMQTILTLLR
jgi:flagellin